MRIDKKGNKLLTLEDLREIARKTSTPEYFEQMRKEEEIREKQRELEKFKMKIKREQQKKDIDKLFDDIEREVDKELSERGFFINIKFK